MSKCHRDKYRFDKPIIFHEGKYYLGASTSVSHKVK